MSKETYLEMLKQKAISSPYSGFQIDRSEINPMCKPHQMDVIEWNVLGGRRACFMSFGLGKTFVQIETARLIIKNKGGKALFITPLGVRQQFTREDGPKLGVKIEYCKTMQEVEAAGDFVITNYERVRNGDIDVNAFTVVCLDEASTLRSTGSETFEVFMTVFTSVPFRFVFTATPSPNRYLELINYGHFLGVMDRGQALTRFFKRDSQKAGNLTIHPHKQKEFWMWLCTWACMVYKPSDLGYSDEGYDLPGLDVIYHEIPADHTKAWDRVDQNGQRFLMEHEAVGIVAGAREKRDSLFPRLEVAKKIVYGDDNAIDGNWLIWHHLEPERMELEKSFPESLSVYGSLDLETRENRVIDFSDGKIKILNTKPELSGSGCNFQRHCHKNVFLGINYDFNDFIQAIHRTYRFLQTEKVQVHIIHTETERSIVNAFKAKWARHIELQENMRLIVKEYGLNQFKTIGAMQRSIGVERKEVTGKNWKLINNDCTMECFDMPDNSIDLIITSIPFSNHYEYTPSYNDFGHTDNDAHFFEQMDYLIPELLRVTKPGRLAAIHTKDRIFYGSRTGDGFSTVNPFHMTTTFEFMKHGWRYMGMAVIHTDVVNENNGNYRLSHGEMKKDGTKMGFGSPEYLLLFRKPQTDKGKAYADEKVANPDYSLGRWQLTADANWRSSGNRLLDIPALMRFANSEDGLRAIRRRFNDFYKSNIYNFEDHVALNEALGDSNKLPTKYHLLQAPVTGEHKDYIWDDVNRLTTLNTNQSQSRRENHVCPLQFDIVDRCIYRFSNPGELIYDPFGGLGTVPYRAVLKGRRGMSTELNEQYFKDSQFYLRAADAKMNMPTLFDAIFEDEKAETAA